MKFGYRALEKAKHFFFLGTVVAGSPHEPMTRSISCDLERRGYVVFVTVSSAEEDRMVQSENRTDIRPLWVDLTTVCVFTMATRATGC